MACCDEFSNESYDMKAFIVCYYWLLQKGNFSVPENLIRKINRELFPDLISVKNPNQPIYFCA